MASLSVHSTPLVCSPTLDTVNYWPQSVYLCILLIISYLCLLFLLMSCHLLSVFNWLHFLVLHTALTQSQIPPTSFFFQSYSFIFLFCGPTKCIFAFYTNSSYSVILNLILRVQPLLSITSTHEQNLYFNIAASTMFAPLVISSYSQSVTCKTHTN